MQLIIKKISLYFFSFFKKILIFKNINAKIKKKINLKFITISKKLIFKISDLALPIDNGNKKYCIKKSEKLILNIIK
jgi:hypothetical protein